MIRKVSIQIIFHPIIFRFIFLFSAFVLGYSQLWRSISKKRLCLDTVKETVVLELVDGVVNAIQNIEVIDVDNVAEAYQVYILQIIFTP